MPREDEEGLRGRIARLSIGVEAHVENETVLSPPKDGPPQRDVVWSGKVNTTEEPIVVMEESAEEEDLSTALLIWKLTATLNRPRVRIPSPVVVWAVKGNLEPASRARTVRQSKYLTSGAPVATNLLESLRDGSRENSRSPYLPSTRLAQRSGRDGGHLQSIPLGLLNKSPLKALPALSSRIRFHRSHKIGDLPTITASLELEIPPHAPSEVDILAVRLKLARGQATELGKQHGIRLPKTCRSRDNLVWLYLLSPLDAFEDPTGFVSPIHLLEVEIDARAIVSDICRPLVHVKWRTNVDFSSAANTVRGSLTFANQPHARPPSSERPTSRTSTETAKPDVEDPEFTMTFVPRGPVYVGEPFKWSVTVVNRSPRTRQLSLMVLQKRKRQAAKRHSHQSSTGSVTAVSKSGTVADAMVDENLLYATVKSSGPDVAHLVSVDSDVRIGPLASGAAAAAELEFLPLQEGHLQPEAIRLTDVTSNEYCDIRQLPSIVAIARDGKSGHRSLDSGEA